jgi:hypothetical protein
MNDYDLTRLMMTVIWILGNAFIAVVFFKAFRCVPDCSGFLVLGVASVVDALSSFAKLVGNLMLTKAQYFTLSDIRSFVSIGSFMVWIIGTCLVVRMFLRLHEKLQADGRIPPALDKI